jgi:non-ribosomal peptide synthetase component F
MFVLQNTPDVPQLLLGDVALSRESFEQNISKFDITFFMSDSPNGLQGSVNYSTDLFSEQTIGKMIAHFKELVGSIVRSPEQKIGMLEMLTGAEKQQLLIRFNESAVTYPK